MKIKAREQGLYAQVIMIFRKNLNNKKEKEMTNKCNFKAQSARSKRSFDIVHTCLEEIFITRESYYQKITPNKY